ncbi:hypothetical protein [Streptomyces sp. XY332]|uniref:hypothetical protein n=1 Tax=Streptomyces sp. XY332 TaxID=1415561 RepID=UPI0006B193CA|nr:hypothetical protein [Streptomyces sp. XY332]KOY50418.1 hypothetical protein ADK59_37005 [Streptomyces sp. XY332]
MTATLNASWPDTPETVALEIGVTTGRPSGTVHVSVSGEFDCDNAAVRREDLLAALRVGRALLVTAAGRPVERLLHLTATRFLLT